MSYPIPESSALAEIVIKKSRFIGHAQAIQTRQEGMAWLAELKKTYPDARHHCWAYLIGNPTCANMAASGDDGEPSGTAGKPILNVLNHKLVGDIMIVVVRYFGGIKLGAGGLTRAYGQAAQAVMEVLPIYQQIETQSINVTVDFKHEQHVRYCCDCFESTIDQVDYQQKVTIHFTTPVILVKALKNKLMEAGISFNKHET